MSKPQSHKPLKRWFTLDTPSGQPAVSRRVKQRGEQVQHRSLSKYRNGISSTQAEALWRRCRECVCKVDNSPEGQSSENNASGRRRARTSSSLPSWAAYVPAGGPGQRSPGPPHPPPWGTPTTLIERRQETTDKLSYVLVGSNLVTDQISGWAPEREHTAPNGKCKPLDVR